MWIGLSLNFQGNLKVDSVSQLACPSSTFLNNVQSLSILSRRPLPGVVHIYWNSLRWVMVTGPHWWGSPTQQRILKSWKHNKTKENYEAMMKQWKRKYILSTHSKMQFLCNLKCREIITFRETLQCIGEMEKVKLRSPTHVNHNKHPFWTVQCLLMP